MSPIIPPAGSKIFDIERMKKLCETWHEKGETIVFTNGCFDILHAGHIKYLETATQLGDHLIIAVNSDESVKKLKGESRPINILSSRLYLLGSLSCVDAVFPFTEETPLEVIKLLKPDVLVKGGDYKIENIVGAREVMSWDGCVEVIPYVDGFSTTNLESKILQLHKVSKKD
ncbi:MAG: D-glycero-beta-D-manno-heptose 1-phosphate adenylyltransferase [Saprospiraceae bacterium]|uniref:D-glycero-beta-D-manno-heptose 1-phosphate adenylyltransferase n=1 Tax=Candidatus Opimibacter skivensis TaxID=2982028 RepID=A0A9D7XPY9_9BACT|nr:D-glycero-beta-D-manno-heptose 1-phosphate adenylyltransferase [Candidatus Opimibacter skivensis]